MNILQILFEIHTVTHNLYSVLITKYLSNQITCSFMQCNELYCFLELCEEKYDYMYLFVNILYTKQILLTFVNIVILLMNQSKTRGRILNMKNLSQDFIHQELIDF